MGTFIVILITIGLLFLGLVAKTNNSIKEDNWKQEQNEELKKLGIINSTEYYYSFDTLAYSARYIVDNTNKKIAIYTSTPGFARNPVKVINFSDLIGVEIFVDSQRCGGIKRAVVGGALAGGDGAIIGAMTAKKEITSLKIVFYTKNILDPEYTIVLLNSNTKTTSINYINAESFSQKVNASIKAILSERNTLNENNSTNELSKNESSTDNKTAELKELKELLQAELISQEDYDAKKKQLLGL